MRKSREYYIDLAIATEDYDKVKYHLAIYGVKLSNNEALPFIENCCFNGNPEILKLLLQNSDIDLQENTTHVISSAILGGNTDCPLILLRDGRFNFSSDGNYGVFLAAKISHYELLEELLQDPKIDPSANNNKAIKEAAKWLAVYAEEYERTSEDSSEEPEYGSYVEYMNCVKLLLQDERVRRVGFTKKTAQIIMPIWHTYIESKTSLMWICKEIENVWPDLFHLIAERFSI